MVRAARAMAMGIRVAGDKEGKGSKAMAIGTRVAGERWWRQEHGQ